MQVGCPNSLFDSVELPVPQKKFPVLPLGNFVANRLVFKEPGMRAGPNFGDIPCIFPVIRQFNIGERFAADCQHSQPVAGFLGLSQPSLPSPEQARK
jgi:hypothetical protein